MRVGEHLAAVQLTGPGEEARWVEGAVNGHGAILFNHTTLLLQVLEASGAAKEARRHIVLRKGGAVFDCVQQHSVRVCSVDDLKVIDGVGGGQRAHRILEGVVEERLGARQA